MPALVGTQIGKLRIRGPREEGLALRRAVSEQLERAELRPRGMPPSAVLIVRSLADPLPGRLSVRPGRAPAESSWRRAVQERLEEFYREAARPERGRLPARAEAIRFEEEGELLACLALDLAHGRHRDRWWWESFLRSSSSGAAGGLFTLLREKARHFPAVASYSDAWEEAAAVVTRLQADEAIGVLKAVAREHGLREPLIPSSSTNEEDTGQRRQEAGQGAQPGEDRGGARAGPAWAARATSPGLRPPPWRRWVPAERALRLTPEQECLLGVGLTLHRAPTRARSSLFAAQVLGWWAGQRTAGSQRPARQQALARPEPMNAQGSGPMSRPAPGTLQPPGESLASTAPPGPAVPPPAPDNALDLTHGSAARRPATGQDHIPGIAFEARPGPPTLGEGSIVEASGVEPVRGRPADSSADTASTADHPSAPGAAPPEESPGAEDTTGVFDSQDAPRAEASDSVTHRLGEGVETRLGGVLYLVNLMQYLGLPECFEPSWCLASGVGAWGLLDVLARALLGSAFGPFAEDLLWVALAELDGRGPRELPGRDFAGGDGFRLPVAWFQSVRSGDDVFAWAASGGRLRVWSAAGEGYVLVDAPLGTTSTAGQADQELSRYAGSVGDGALTAGAFEEAPVATLWNPLATELNPNLARWLTLAIPCIRHRLRHALNIGAADVSHPSEELLTVPGWLYVTATHVDLVAGLDAISVPARWAGLDRDPGWVPELGRVVSFHFE